MLCQGVQHLNENPSTLTTKQELSYRKVRTEERTGNNITEKRLYPGGLIKASARMKTAASSKVISSFS